METLTVKVPHELRQRLAAEARRRNVSQSVVVRESLEFALATSSGATEEPSCADVMGDMLGSVRSGYADLATNKTHLEELVLHDFDETTKRRR